MKLKTLLLTSMAITASVFAKANTTPGDNCVKKQDLLGGVYTSNSKKPISHVAVTAYHLTTKKEKVVVTDAQGNYSFYDLQPGAYKFVFAKDGYKKVTKENVQIKEAGGFHMNVEMMEHTTFDYMPGPFHFLSFE